MNLRARRALDAGTLVTDFNTSSFSIVQSLAKLWNKFKVVIVVQYFDVEHRQSALVCLVSIPPHRYLITVTAMSGTSRAMALPGRFALSCHPQNLGFRGTAAPVKYRNSSS
jgi:hypothetical protein